MYPQSPDCDPVTSCFKYLELSAKINAEFALFLKEYFITAIGNKQFPTML